MATKKNMVVNGCEYFRITRTVGHKVVDGEKVPIKKQFIGTSKRNAEQKYEEWKEAQRKKNARIIDNGKTFCEVADYFTDNVLAVDSGYARTTRKSYASVYKKHIRNYEELTNIPIVDVVVENVQTMYNNLPVSKSVIKTINKFMVAFYKWLARNRFAENIMPSVVIPDKVDNRRTDVGEIVVRSDEEMRQISACLGDHRLRFLVLLAACTGMRISELFGLKYSDFSNDFVRVDRQYCDGEFCPPKNESYRIIPLNKMAKKELHRHVAWHVKEMKNRNYKTEFVFTTSTGKLLGRGNVRQQLTRFYRKNEIEEKKFHAYRATFCTNLCKAGVRLQTASKLMGHKTIEVTAAFYTSIDKNEKREAVNMLPDFTD